MAKKANPELVRYIERHLSKGFKIKHIKKKLAEVGHPIEAIEDAAEFVTSTRPSSRKKPAAFMIIYGLLLIVLLVVLGLFIFTKVTEQLEYVEEVREVEKVQLFTGMSDLELIKYAKANDEPAACENIGNHNLYYACVDRYWEKGDCGYERLIDEGVSACFKDLAFSTKDPRNCLKTDDSTSCLTELATKFNDEDLCFGSYDCVYKIAVSKEDAGVCSSLSGSIEEDCFDEYAKETGNVSVCDEGSVTCRYFFAKTEEEKEVFITNLEEDITNRELNVDTYDIIFELASENKDIFLCKFLKSFKSANRISLETLCAIRIGLNTTDSTKCNVLSDESQKNLCFDFISSGCAANQKICADLEE